MDVAEVIAELGRSSQGLISAAELTRAGVSRSMLSRAVQRGAVRRVRRRVYALTPLEPLPRFVVTDTGVSPQYLAHVRAVLLGLGPSTTACGRTAAALRGWGMLVEPARTVEVAVRHGRSRLSEPLVGAVQRRSLGRELFSPVEGMDRVWTATAVQTVVDCALALPLLQAVVVCDSALRAEDVTFEELIRMAEHLPGRRDAAKIRRVIDLCDPLSGSVLESVLRVHMMLAGISGFASQTVVRDLVGQHLRVDFCFEQAGLVVEVDGRRWHQDPTRDQARDNALAVLGWRVLRFTWAQVVHDSETVLAEIRAAVACATPSFHLAAMEEDHAA